VQRWSVALSVLVLVQVLGLARGERRGFGGGKSRSRLGRQDSVGYSVSGPPWRRGVGAGRWTSASAAAEGRDGGEVGDAGIACEVIEHDRLGRRRPFLEAAEWKGERREDGSKMISLRQNSIAFGTAAAADYLGT